MNTIAKNNLKRCNGFSLVEMLAVIAIVYLLFSIICSQTTMALNKAQFTRWRMENRQLAIDPDCLFYVNFEKDTVRGSRLANLARQVAAGELRGWSVGAYQRQEGVIVGSPSLVSVTLPPMEHRAMQFNGIDQRIIFYGTPCATDEVTHMAWVKPYSHRNLGTIVTSPYSTYFHLHSTGALRAYTCWGPATGSYQSSTYDNSTGTVPLNKWSHVAFTEDKTGMRRFYINGKPSGQAQRERGIYPADRYLMIGGGYGAIDVVYYYFHGLLDEIFIFKRALTQSELQRYYDRSKLYFPN